MKYCKQKHVYKYRSKDQWDNTFGKKWVLGGRHYKLILLLLLTRKQCILSIKRSTIYYAVNKHEGN